VYTWSLVLTPWLRKELLKDGWKHFGKIFILAIILDIIYQMITVKGVYLLELLITAVVLALLPYILTRGPAARIIRLGKKLGKKE
jgi:hypothetical protein